MVETDAVVESALAAAKAVMARAVAAAVGRVVVGSEWLHLRPLRMDMLCCSKLLRERARRDCCYIIEDGDLQESSCSEDFAPHRYM